MIQIAKIQEQIENKPWKTAITIFKNGKSLFENSFANTTYNSASLIKLAIALYIQEVKPNTINNEITLSPNNMVGGAGVINRLSIKRWKSKDLIDLMLSISDNSATNALLSYYHLDDISYFLQQNFQNISLNRFLMEEATKENTCTSNSMMKIFQRLLKGDNEVNEIILNSLKHQTVRNKLVAYSNPRFETFNKTGELLHEQHDIARFKSKNEIIDCCVLTNYQNQKDYEGILNMMQNIGKILTQ